MLGVDLAKVSLEDIKAKNSKVFDAIMAMGAASVPQGAESAEAIELATQLKAANLTIAKLQTESKIRTQAYKLNLVAQGETLISEGKSLEESLVSLIDASASGQGAQAEGPDLGTTFRKTAPPSAGSSPEPEVDLTMNTQEKAIAFFKVGKTTEGEATKLARRAYPNLFTSQFAGQGGN